MDNSLADTAFTRITSADPAYHVWNNRAVNLDFTGTPSLIIPVGDEEELANALQSTINQHRHFAIRGGGHCLENFVSNPEVDVVIDISSFKGIRYDPLMNAIEIKAGNTVGEVHSFLHHNWQVVLPMGEHPDIGIGGHIQGGAFGFLCREMGLGADYLYAVELLHVTEQRLVSRVVATREPNDPNRELWWAFTGGGAGNFGVVTRFWFRSREANEKDPRQLLAASPASIETVELEWQWSGLDESSFSSIIDVFGNWCLHNSQPGSPGNGFFATMHLFNKQIGKIQMKGVLTNADLGSAALDSLLESFGNIAVPFGQTRKKMDWLDFSLHPFPDIFVEGKSAFKGKDAFMLKPFSKNEIAAIYKCLSSHSVPGAFAGMATYGGKINEVDAADTSSVQRSAIMATAYAAGWGEAKDREESIQWTRDCYSAVFAGSGGAPVPGERYGGCIIAHPDRDLADPLQNKSGTPWFEFYYQFNYPRLLKVKERWDPLNLFRHALSVGV